MECKFEAGQRAVCVNPNPHWVSLGSGEEVAGPAMNQIVRIREVKKVTGHNYEIIGLNFAEFQENGYFDHRFFRPLNERPNETTIEVFKKLLPPAPKPSIDVTEDETEDA